MTTLTTALVLCAIGQDERIAPDAGKVPESLRAAFIHRMAIDTAHIRHRLITTTDTGVLDRFHEDRSAGEDFLTINRGDRDGIMGRRLDGTLSIGVGLAFCPERRLVSWSTGDVWNYLEGHYSAELYDCSPGRALLGYDVRSLGLGGMLSNCSPAAGFASLEAAANRKTWTETTDERGRIHVRSVERSQKWGTYISDWVIDPRMDFAVLESTSKRIKPDGTEVPGVHTETTYARFDGMWFPKTWVGRSVSDDFELRCEVLEATFNRKEHPNPLTPKLLEMPIGIIVASPRWGPAPGPIENPNMKRWDGEKLVDYNEWERIKQNYDLSEYDRLMGAETVGKYPKWWRDESGTFGLEGGRYRPGLWEDYVRRWGYKRTYGVANPLTGEQKAGAQAVLKDCQKRAAPIFQRIEKELTEVEKKLDDKTLAPEARQAASKKKAELTAPIEHIFATQLVPRLEALLETRQTGPAASQPAAPTPGGSRPSP